MKTFRLPVEWSVYSFVEIEAETIKDAVKKFHEVEDDLPLPTEPEYIDGSFKLSTQGFNHPEDDYDYYMLFN